MQTKEDQELAIEQAYKSGVYDGYGLAGSLDDCCGVIDEEDLNILWDEFKKN